MLTMSAPSVIPAPPADLSGSSQFAFLLVWPMPGFNLLMGIERTIERGHVHASWIDMTDIVLSRVLRAAGIEFSPHSLFECGQVRTFA